VILFIERIGGDKSRESFRLQKPEDFEPLFHEYPEARAIAMFSSSMEEAADDICKYLSRNDQDAWVEKDHLSKGIRDLAAGLSMVAAGAMPMGSPTSQPTQHTKIPTHVAATKNGIPEFGTQPEDKFLWNISNVESQNGQNTNHKKILHGPMAGNTAIGRWGLLKPTINEMLDRMGKAGQSKPELESLRGMNRDQIAKHFQENPEHELGIARFLAKHVLHRQHGDNYRAAYAWTMGHNLSSHQINPKELNGHFYVEMYKKAEKKNPFMKHASKKLRNIAATAAMQAQEAQAMEKSEDKSAFKDRLKKWKTLRADEARERLWDDSSHSYDPGRIRDDEAIEGPKDNNEKVKRALKRMAEGKE
jgi:hypothetical protein